MTRKTLNEMYLHSAAKASYHLYDDKPNVPIYHLLLLMINLETRVLNVAWS